MEVETANHLLPQDRREEMLAMGKGDGEESYDQKSEIEGFVNKVLVEALEKVTLPSSGPVVVADLGSSSGPHSIDNVALIVNKLRSRIHEDAEFQAYFNDLPSNDFNNLFQLLTNDSRTKNFFAAGAPGSFYDRLFAESTVHVFYSSICLHWLSKIPDAVLDKDSPAFNRGKVWTIHSRSAVAKAYQQQASLDLKTFLLARGAELVPGGLLFFTFPGRCTSEPNEPTDDDWEDFTSDFNAAWSDLVAEGLLTEEQLDTFNLPCYMRNIEDLEEAIGICGSLFDVLMAKMHTVEISPHEVHGSVQSEPNVLSRNVRAVYKAVVNGFVEDHVGKEVAELIWHRYEGLFEKRIKMEKTMRPLFIVALMRK